MKKNQKFLVCEHCGNLVAMIEDAGVKIMCCGQPMTEIQANTVDASNEKHLPQVKVEGSKVSVNVGSVEHPMLDEHLINWIYLLTSTGCHMKELSANEAPKADFVLAENETPVAAYSYCNLHGLWKTEI